MRKKNLSNSWEGASLLGILIFASYMYGSVNCLDSRGASAGQSQPFVALEHQLISAVRCLVLNVQPQLSVGW